MSTGSPAVPAKPAKGRPLGGKKYGGRVAGTPNKFTATIKDMIIGALNKVGGQEYLARQAELNPGPFMALVGKVLPTQVTGADGQPLGFIVIPTKDPS